MPPGQDLEIEVKFFIEDDALLKNKLLSAGAESHGRVFETNVRYEDEALSLQKGRCLLRLRKDDKVRLTVKTDPARPDMDFKILRELEVTVSDFDTMDKILNILGFQKAQIYEKWRETFVLNEALLCLDVLPYGVFLEIEGSKKAIRKTANALGLDWNGRILGNYLEMFDHLRREEGLMFTDVTFENFKNNPVRFENYRNLFEARTA